MNEMSNAPDVAAQAKAAAAVFGALLTPGFDPALKAQADLLGEAETNVTAWLHRCHEAVADTQKLVAQLRTSKDPFDVLRLQQEWVSRAFLRLAADTAAYQSTTLHLADRAKTWFPQAKAFTEGVAAVDAVGHASATAKAAGASAGVHPLRDNTRYA